MPGWRGNAMSEEWVYTFYVKLVEPFQRSVSRRLYAIDQGRSDTSERPFFMPPGWLTFAGITEMKKTILWYSLAAAALILLLKLLEYQLFVRALALEFYLAVISVLCTTLGVWAGIRLTHRRTIADMPTAAISQRDEKAVDASGLSKRELEVLELMARGLSNQEIADALFVSLNTIKTHAANLFVKLDARRRTQAIQRGKTLGLIP